MAGNESPAKLWWAAPAAGILALLALAMLFGKPPEEAKAATSYDASGQGFRAAYLLLEDLGYRVARLKRLTGRGPRLVFFPATTDQADSLDGWVRDGGLVVLADPAGDFAGKLGLVLQVRERDQDPGEEPASGAGIARLAGGPTEVETKEPTGEVWAEAGGRPAITIYPHGRGAIWLVNRPEFLSNRLLRRADNAVLLCRLAGAVLDRQPGELEFDEYFHGMRDRPGVAELLLQPPMTWVTLQGLLAMGLLLWHYLPRFGTPRPVPVPRRRSKEEFLDAMAALLERKRDYADAYRAARDDLLREIERQLGLPPSTPAGSIVREATRRRALPPELLRRLLETEAPAVAGSPAAFLKALNELETVRDGLFSR